MQWTTQQLAAIESRDKNLLVAAAAGSGKTAVLVERIIKMILDGEIDVDKMLVVTFTNAAAQEMRTRIHKKIFERMQTVADSDQIARLERQAILLSGASIMTFHAFCLSILRRNFSKIDFEPKFREAGEQELNILKQEVVEKLFEEKYSTGEDTFKKFTDEFGGNVHGDTEIHKLIIDLHKFAQSRPYPEDWLKSVVNFYENPETARLPDGKILFEEMINFALEQANFIITDVAKNCAYIKKSAAEQIIDTANATKKDIDAYQKNWTQIISFFEREYRAIAAFLNAIGSWDKLYELKLTFSFVDYPRTKKFPADLLELKKQFKATRDDYKERFKKLDGIFYANRAGIIAQIKKLAPSVRRLAEVTIEFAREFSAAKRERGIIDFDDMEHLALKILTTDKATADSYRRKFKMIMVDEYQDTNGVQEEIISRIVDEKNFFAVGDVKQSIYRFRNAAPEIFMTKYDNYPTTSDCQRIDLSANFRSRRQVVDAVNAIFRRLMTKDAMEIDYNKDAELNFGADYPAFENTFDERAEFLIVNLEQETSTKISSATIIDDEDESAEKIDLDELGLEMQVIADKIKKLIADKKNIFDTDTKTYRPIQYKDIVILMRAVDQRAAKILDIMNKNGIPTYAADNKGYFSAPEIQTTLCLLSLLDNSRQDIPLAAVMLSPIGGFTEQNLVELRLTDRKADLYTLVKNFSEGESELAAKCKNFLERINAWREIARQVSVPELLSTIYRETGYYDYFGTKIDGRTAQANLRMLIDRAAEFESTAFRGLSRFIQFIKKIRELENDLSAARTLGENENVVRVMTIHKSKGLEFPVVFVAQLGKRFNTRDTSENVLFHQNFGIGIYQSMEALFGLTRTKNFVREIIKQKLTAENLAEELRILYVAMTRAREKLFLTGTVKNEMAFKFDSYDLSDDSISPLNLLSAKRPIQWLLKIRNFIKKVIPIEIFSKSEIKAGDDEVDAVAKKIQSPPEVAEDSPLSKIPAKLSVTEIKRRIAEFEDETAQVANLTAKKFDKTKLYRRPTFMQRAEMSAAEFGTAMHGVMQHLNLKADLDAENISAQIDEMITAQIFTVEQGDAVKRKIGNITNFFSSKLGQRLLNSTEIYRELPFSRRLDAGTINAGENFQRAAGEKIFVQGIIDLLFKDSATGKWILLDYKTDRNNTDEYFRNEYREQIRFYVEAVESLTGYKIAETYLYLLGAGRFVSML